MSRTCVKNHYIQKTPQNLPFYSKYIHDKTLNKLVYSLIIKSAKNIQLKQDKLPSRKNTLKPKTLNRWFLLKCLLIFMRFRAPVFLSPDETGGPLCSSILVNFYDAVSQRWTCAEEISYDRYSHSVAACFIVMDKNWGSENVALVRFSVEVLAIFEVLILTRIVVM